MKGWIAFLIAGFALAGSPGPANLSLAATGAAYGARRGIGYLAGIIAGMAVVILLTASGVSSVLWALPGAKQVLVPLAAAYFCYLAYRIATAPPLSAPRQRAGGPSFLAGVLLSLINPKAYAAMAALFSGFVWLREATALALAFRLTALAGIVVLVTSAWLLSGSSLTRLCRDARLSRAVNITFAILLLGSLALALAL